MNSDDFFNTTNSIVRKTIKESHYSKWRTSSDDLDKEFEEFWLSFKQSMINFYNIHKYIERPIELWSDTLNDHKKNMEYSEIEKCIHKYITLYSLDVLRSMNMYHFRILETNVRRWKQLRSIYKFVDTSIDYENMVYLFIDVMKACMKVYQTNDDELKLYITYFFQELEFIMIYKEYYKIIMLSYKTNTPSILDKLNKYISLSNYIYDIYEINIPKTMSGKKILELLKKHNI